jgi:PadR family transcriptional regulator PadR
MSDQNRKNDVWQGTMALMILKTLEAMGSQHGYGIARRIEQISGDRLSLNYGSIYPALLRLEQERAIASEWGTSENNRKAKYYKLTAAGRKLLRQQMEEWQETSDIVARFLAVKESL